MSDKQLQTSKKEKRKPFHEEFAEKIISHLEAGTAPWQKPWHPGKVLAAPHNPVSGSVYRGMNRVNLALSGYEDPRWVTLRQANSRGMRIMPGSKATPVVYYQFTEERDRVGEDGKPILDKDGKPEKQVVALERPLVRFAHVFNCEQIDGMPPLELTDKAFEWEPVEKAESILSASGADIRHDQSDRAFYRIATDEIHLPPKENFEEPGLYYGTALHELGHWTRHESRLNRESGPFGSEPYAREELRAEISSWMLGQDIGVPHDPGQHAAYVGSWVKALKEDPFEIVRACRDAEQIKGYIMKLEMRKELTTDLSIPLLWVDDSDRAQLERLGAEPPLTLGSAWHIPAGKNIHDFVELLLKSPSDSYLERYAGDPADAPPTVEERLEMPRFYIHVEETYGVPGQMDYTVMDRWGEMGLSSFTSSQSDESVDEMKGKAERLTAMLNNLADQELQHEVMQNKQQNMATEKTLLVVPFKEKEQAKKLGAKWDKKNKLWYAPEGANLAPLGKWLGGQEKPVPHSALSPTQELGKLIAEMGGDLRGETPVMDGKIHRVPCFNRQSGNKDFSYCVYNDAHPAGWVQNFATGERVTWAYSAHELTEEEKIELRKRQTEHAEARRIEQIKEHNRIAEVCAAIFKERTPANGDHGYLVAKGVEPNGAKVTPDGQRLVVPLFNSSGEVRSLQYISENGFKGFEPGAEKKGNFFVLGCAVDELRGQDKILLAEGFSTSASVHQASGLPTVMAGDIYNMEAVAGEIRKIAPEAKIYICSDNDHARKLPDGRSNNIGVDRAREVAAQHKAQVIIPQLTKEEKGKGLKDFNDIHTSRGLAAVKKQIEAGLEQSKEKELMR